MNTQSSARNDIRWIVLGAVAILIAGMAIVTFLSTQPGDNTATIAAVGSMVTLGVGGVFGLSKLNEVQAQRASAVVEKIDENTKITTSAASEARDAAVVAAEQAVEIKHQLNGGLDARMKACAEQAIVEAMPRFREEMLDVLNEFTRPR